MKCLSNLFHGRAAAIAGGIAFASLPGAAALGQSVGTFAIRVNNGPVQSVQCFATPAAEVGKQKFAGAAIDAGGMWEATWEYTGDLDPDGNAQLQGFATILNKGAEAADFDVSFDVPVCPFISTGALMGGSCVLKITMDENGGVLSAPPGSQIFGAIADDAVTAKVFYGPFNMGSTGAGTAQTMSMFGAPFPSYNVSAVMKNFGMRQIFKLSDGDQVQITGNVVLGGEPENFVSCESNAPSQPASIPSPAMPAADPSEPTAPPSMTPAAAMAAPGAPTSSSVRLHDDSGKRITIAAGGPSAGSKKPMPSAKKAAPQRKPPARSSNSSSSKAKTPSRRSNTR